jgi:hypothetical protein
MKDQVTVRFDDTVWHDVFRAHAATGAPPLRAGLVDQLAKASKISQTRPFPAETRVATFTAEQAGELERWLVDVTGRDGVPASMGEALRSVREGIRLAQ